MPTPHVSPSELARRASTLRSRLQAMGAQATVITEPVNVFYLTNLSFITTERPMALFLPIDGEPFMFIPMVEMGHAEHRARLFDSPVKDFRYYFDYPGERHVMELLADQIASSGVKVVALDSPAGAPGLYGYRGPKLSELLERRGIKVLELGDTMAELRLTKSEEEVRLIEESARWASRALEVALELLEPNRWDWDVMLEANLKVMREMNDAYRPYTPMRTEVGWAVGFRGQVGEFSAFPHALVAERPVRAGDVVGVGAGPEVGGYFAELERTLFVGSPEPRALELFDRMLRLREAALEVMKPGVRVSEVDAAVRRRARELGVENLLRHHTGHGLGLEGHEPPFLDVGYQGELREGMVVSVEPGIYVPGLGGFRHSDTVLISRDGPVKLTKYPEDADELTLRR